MPKNKPTKATGKFRAKGQPQNISRKTNKPAAFSYPYGSDVLATDYTELDVRVTAGCNDEVPYEDS